MSKRDKAPKHIRFGECALGVALGLLVGLKINGFIGIGWDVIGLAAAAAAFLVIVTRIVWATTKDQTND